MNLAMLDGHVQPRVLAWPLVNFSINPAPNGLLAERRQWLAGVNLAIGPSDLVAYEPG